MRLSEAMALGKMVYRFNSLRYVCDGEGCGLGLGYMAATGITQYASPSTIRNQWPWLALNEAQFRTRWWHKLMFISAATFGNRIEVMAFHCDLLGKKPFSSLCDQVRAWEDELESKGVNVEQVTMIATPETTHEPAAEHTKELGLKLTDTV